MKKKISTFSMVFLCSFYTVFAVPIKWTGSAGDGLWETPANWSTNEIPSTTDDVIFDNISGVNGSYIVTLPTSVSVTVNSITISPTSPSTIVVILPSANTLSPALTVTKAGYSIIIGNGGLFKNSSTAPSGSALVLNDSLQILNGGAYIQNSKTGHAVLVTKLSKAPGTESGTFEFDVPTTAGYTVSITGRTYGNLVLSATAAGGTRTYTSTGSSPLTINGNFKINTGVTYSIDLNNNITIKGDFIHNGNSIDLSSQINNTKYSVKGNISSASNSIIKNTNGNPVIELNGNTNQNIDIKGSIQNTVSFRLNNNTATLLSPLLLPYKFDLLNGVLNTTSANLLVLKSSCTILCDSLSGNIFINGPMRKEGLNVTDHFIFPVGKDDLLRWVELKNSTGNFTVEYFKNDPNIFGNTVGPGIHHISSLEYWSIESDVVPSANVELSFVNPVSGSISDISTLLVAQLESGNWVSNGNAFTSGNAATSGSVVSNGISSFTSATKYFTFGTTIAENALPLKLLYFNAIKSGETISLKWSIDKSFRPKYFDIESSDDGIQFSKTGTKQFIAGVNEYEYKLADNATGNKYVRLFIKENERGFYSKTISFAIKNDQMLMLYPSVVNENLYVRFRADKPQTVICKVVSFEGRTITLTSNVINKGVNNFQLNIMNLKSGKYVVQFFADGKFIKSLPFIRE